ncbi:hypothetical protein IFM51744_10107 [Aspergillus udagawae]|nr:hypothetical protein IFM51744_10107 [Aspergillus udagawae]
MDDNRVEDPSEGCPSAPKTDGPGLETFDREWDDTYFNHFRLSPHELSFLVVHDLRYLHMKNIYYYQMELLKKYPAETELNNGNVQELRRLLGEYCQALQNYEFVLRLSKPSNRKARVQRECLEHVGAGDNIDRNDHRVIHGSAVGFLDRMFSQDLSDAAENKKIRLRGKFDILFRDVSVRDIIRRVVVGTFVGAPFLLVPMIILQFRTTTAWKLTTVSVAVVVFSIFLAICSDQSNAEHVVAVAAYAAVMVVFIGTTTPAG